MLEAVIGILGRSVFPEDKLRDMVTKYKKNPEQYVRGYNLCDGEHAVIDIAKEIGVAGPVPDSHRLERSWHYLRGDENRRKVLQETIQA